MLGDHFYWTRLQHHAAEEKKYPHKVRCLQAIATATATEFARKILRAAENTQAGASIHIWLPFAEYVRWNPRTNDATFVFDGVYEEDLKNSLCSLVRESCVPVFVSFCTSSDFHHGGEMQMERTIDKIALELSRARVAISLNQQMWSECSNFTDANLKALNPNIANPTTDADSQWNRNAAFSCLDKFLFREKMLYACAVGDATIMEMEKALSDVAMDWTLCSPSHLLKYDF